MSGCDFCGKVRKAHRSHPFRDAYGSDADVDVCFLCDREGQRGRVYSRKHGGYVDASALAAGRDAAEEARQMEWLRNHPDTTPADLENYQDIPF